MLAVLFSILYQSVHSYEHFADHENIFSISSDDDGAAKVQMLDHDHQKCFVCDFALGSFIAVEFTAFNSYTFTRAFAYVAFHATEIPQVFSGSLFAHRGPPSGF